MSAVWQTANAPYAHQSVDGHMATLMIPFSAVGLLLPSTSASAFSERDWCGIARAAWLVWTSRRSAQQLLGGGGGGAC